MTQLLTSTALKVFEILLPALATALAGLLVAFVTKKLQSIGITVEVQQQQQLKDLATHTVLAVEEQAKRTGLSGEQKDTLAVAKVQEKLPNAKPADVRDAIDAALPRARAIAPSTPGTFGRRASD